MTLIPAVYVVNESSVLTDAQVQNAIPAFQAAVTYDFRPVWDAPCHVTWLPRGSAVPPGGWLCAISDTSDQAGALAYHSLDGKAVPTLSVFAKTEQQYGASWTVSLTHELFEALADPYCMASMGQQLPFYGLEVCDPVEADDLAYGRRAADGTTILISDFVTPHWFIPGAPGPYSYRANVSKPLELAKGGYASVYRSGGWTQISNFEAAPGRESSRPERHGPGYRHHARNGKGLYHDQFVSRL